MAAAVDRRMSQSRSSTATSFRARSPTEIRYSDVAHYVGLSLVNSPQRAKSSQQLSRKRSAVSSGKPTDSPQHSREEDEDDYSESEEEELPSAVQVGRAERLRCQLEWLKAEQRAEKEQLHRLEGCLSDSLLLERKAQRRAAKHRELRDFHQHRAQAVEEKIDKLRGQLEVREVEFREASARSRSSPSRSSHLMASTFPKHAVKLDKADPSQSEAPHSANRNWHWRQAARRQEAPRQSERSGLPIVQRPVSAHQAGDEGLPSLNSSGGRRVSERPPDVPKISANLGEVALSAAHSSRGSEGEQETRRVDDEEHVSSVSLKDFMDMRAEGTLRATIRQNSFLSGSLKHEFSSDSLQQSYMMYNSEDDGDIAEIRRETVRKELIRIVGDDREVFRRLDYNKSGSISSQDFADGVTRLGVKWNELTGLRRARDLFRLFDEDKDGVITFKELFPESMPREPKRMSTPEFVGYYLRHVNNTEKMSTRCARWQPSSPDDKVKSLVEAAQFRESVERKKKWMSSTIRRLKTRGKSDARCREIVAKHLPRGTGPKDLQDVPIFSGAEVRSCKKAYTDGYMDPVKRIQKVVVDMKEQKRDVKTVKDQLFLITEAKIMQQRAEEERRNVASSLSGISVLARVKDPLADEDKVKHETKSFKRLAEENGMEEDVVAEVYREYCKFADSSELLGRKAFTRLLQVLCPKRTLAESDVDAWWGQITRSQEARISMGSRRTQCKFDEFIAWYSTSEALLFL